MEIYFDETVEVTASQKTINELTLLTRLGGTIGVGKEMLAILLLLGEFIILFHTKIINKFFCV